MPPRPSLLDHPFYVGENIFASSGTATPHDAVLLLPVYGWASEGAHYHYDTSACDAGATCSHYTQVVWRATTKLVVRVTSEVLSRWSSSGT